jgi:hypothetical protein
MSADVDAERDQRDCEEGLSLGFNSEKLTGMQTF